MNWHALTGRAAQLISRLQQESGNFIGICFAVAATFLLIAVSAVGKHIAQELHPFIATFIRSLMGVLLIVPWYLRSGLSGLRTAQPLLTVGRGFIFSLAIIAWFWSLPRVSLDLVTALGFSAQLFSILGAVLFLGEASRRYRWAGLAVGFAGAIVIIRPGFAELSLGVWAVLASAVLFSITRVTGKILVRTDTPSSLVVWQMGLVAVFSLPFALFVWQWPTLEQWLWLVLLAVLTVINNLAGAWAIRFADIGAIEPVSFLRLVWAALVGFVVFAEVPNLFTILGGVIVMGSVIYIARRERQEGRAPTETAI